MSLWAPPRATQHSQRCPPPSSAHALGSVLPAPPSPSSELPALPTGSPHLRRSAFHWGIWLHHASRTLIGPGLGCAFLAQQPEKCDQGLPYQVRKVRKPLMLGLQRPQISPIQEDPGIDRPTKSAPPGACPLPAMLPPRGHEAPWASPRPSRADPVEEVTL